MTSQLESRLAFLTEDAEAVAAEVAAEIARLKAACALAMKRLRQHRQTMEQVASLPLANAHAKAVMSTIETEYGFTVTQLRGSVRTARLAEARQVGIWLLNRAGWKAIEAGAAFDRTRSNSCHAIAAIESRRETEPKFRDKTNRLAAALGIE